MVLFLEDTLEISSLLKDEEDIMPHGSFPTFQEPLSRLCRDPIRYQLGGNRASVRTPRSPYVSLSIMCSLWNGTVPQACWVSTVSQTRAPKCPKILLSSLLGVSYITLTDSFLTYPCPTD